MTALRLLSLSFLVLGACSGGDGGAPTNAAVEAACTEVCAAIKVDCTAFDEPTCASSCPAYAVLIEEGTSCESAYLAYQACLETTTYTCVGDYAFPAGTECDTLEATCDASCDSPCL